MEKSALHFMRGAICGLLGLVLWGTGRSADSLGHSARDSVPGVVTHVVDGDTFYMAVAHMQTPVAVRIAGVDAPEICQEYGTQARQRLQALLHGKQVRVQVLAIDKYERIVARVWVRNSDVGASLVRHGHAWAYYSAGSKGGYQREERVARERAVGLWANADAIRPQGFRRRFGSCMRMAQPQ